MTGAPGVWGPDDLVSYAGPLLLDTHVWVWYLDGDLSRMTAGVGPLLEGVARSGELCVLDISYWEVAVKTAKGKLVFSIEPAVWLGRAEKAAGIRFLPLDREILLLSTRLPGSMHNDPADRMLIAAAQLNGVPLVTADDLIIRYAEAQSGICIVDARP